MLVLIAALRDGRKVVLAVENGYRESTESWAALLRDLKGRGLRAPRLLIADGHLGIWGAVSAVFPTVGEQRCWNHRLVNVVDTLPTQLQSEARDLLTKIPYAETRAEAERQKRVFQAWATKKGGAAAGRRLDEDWERLVTFYAFPKEHWKHLRTTNVVESPFAAVRLRTEAAKRFKKVENATAVIWKTLLVAEQHFRRLDAPERFPEVAEGAVSTARGRSGATRRPPPDLVYTLIDKTSPRIELSQCEVDIDKLRVELDRPEVGRLGEFLLPTGEVEAPEQQLMGARLRWITLPSRSTGTFRRSTIHAAWAVAIRWSGNVMAYRVTPGSGIMKSRKATWNRIARTMRTPRRNRRRPARMMITDARMSEFSAPEVPGY